MTIGKISFKALISWFNAFIVFNVSIKEPAGIVVAINMYIIDMFGKYWLLVRLKNIVAAIARKIEKAEVILICQVFIFEI